MDIRSCNYFNFQHFLSSGLVAETFRRITEMWLKSTQDAVISNGLQEQAHAGLIEQHVLGESISDGIDLNDTTEVICRKLVYNDTVLAQLTRIGGCYKATVFNYRES